MQAIVNRKAKFDYSFLETYTCGISLKGSEVKSIRVGNVSMVDSYCIFDRNELWIKSLNITPGASSFQHDPLRDKKLLLKKKELRKLEGSLLKGLTIIPIKIFTNERNLIKIEIALAQGKKNYDKREDIKKRDTERELRRNLI
jgi:SsrA-binding protein